MKELQIGGSITHDPSRRALLGRSAAALGAAGVAAMGSGRAAAQDLGVPASNRSAGRPIPNHEYGMPSKFEAHVVRRRSDVLVNRQNFSDWSMTPLQSQLGTITPNVPVIKHLDGNCHVYVDDPCDIAMAVAIADNAKTQKYSPCNAAESLLVARAVAADFLPKIAAIYAAKGVEMRCDQAAAAVLRAQAAINSVAKIIDASEQDWYAEYLAPVISIKVVEGIDQAIAHINQYSSHHTDAIITRDHWHAQRFLREVDSASVMVNASTRFADGFEFGLGAEIGISTDKFHARGPVGIEGLTSLKYVVLGEGEVRL